MKKYLLVRAEIEMNLRHYLRVRLNLVRVDIYQVSNPQSSNPKSMKPCDVTILNSHQQMVEVAKAVPDQM